MNCYFAYGLSIDSEVELPGVPRTSQQPNVVVRVKRDTNWEHPSLRPGWSWTSEMDNQEFRLFTKDVGTYVVKEGRQVDIHLVKEAVTDLFHVYLMGTVAGMLLHQRGFLALHASALQIGDKAVLFLGGSGFGKSSIAAALYSRGYPVVADDLSAVRIGARRPTITPGFPRLKLRPNVAEFLPFDPATLAPLPHVEGKVARSVADRFSAGILPVAGVCVLDREGQPEFESMAAQQAVMALVRESYPTRMFLVGGAEHLSNCANLVRRVPVFQLRSFTELNELPKIVEVVLSEFEKSEFQEVS